MAEPARMAVAAPRPPSDLAAVHTQPVAAASRPVAISLDGLSVDPASERTQVGQVRIALSGTEFSLLYALAASAGRVVSSDELMRAGWSGEAVREGTLDVTMHRLRKRLAQAPGGEGLIRTVRGQGYVLSAAPASRNAAA
jgi:two-component system response regulator AdeR